MSARSLSVAPSVSQPESDVEAEILASLARAERRRSWAAKRRTAGVWAARVLTLVATLGIWQWLADTNRINTLFFSSPSHVGQFLQDNLGTSEIWSGALVTLRETLIGFSIGSAAGVLVALILVNFSLAERVLAPFFTLLNALPRVALAPMFIIWFGIGQNSKIALAVSLIFFITMVSTEAGARSVDREYLTMLRAMGARKWQLFRLAILPGSVPGIFAGLRLAVVYSLLGVVFGEMLAAQSGLGQQIARAANNFNTPAVLGTLLVLAFIALLLNAVVQFIERWLLRWNA